MAISTISKNTYIVDEGEYTHTDGGAHVTWEYRKWSDGTAECWGKFGSAAFGPQANMGNFFGRIIGPYNFPPNLFVDIPAAFFNLRSWGNGYFFGQVRRHTKDIIYCEVFRSDNVASEGEGGIYAIGRWK